MANYALLSDGRNEIGVDACVVLIEEAMKK